MNQAVKPIKMGPIDISINGTCTFSIPLTLQGEWENSGQKGDDLLKQNAISLGGFIEHSLRRYAPEAVSVDGPPGKPNEAFVTVRCDSPEEVTRLIRLVRNNQQITDAMEWEAPDSLPLHALTYLLNGRDAPEAEHTQDDTPRRMR